MKITLEPTEDQELRKPNAKHCRILIQAEDDDLNIHDVVESLIRPALLAWGFQEGSVNDVLVD